MSKLAITKETTGTVEQLCEKVTEVIKQAGFGVLTRIDFDQKLKEKINAVIPKTVILGACHPQLAYEAFQQSTDVALLIPCNIVVRDLGHGKVMVEAARPSQMLAFLKDVKDSAGIHKVEEDLAKVILAL